MSWQIILAWFVRYVHIASAIGAIGAPFFVRLALLPAASQTLDDATHQALRQKINARWSKVVYGLIALFLITGFYSFLIETRLPDTVAANGMPVRGALITARWRDFSPEDRKLYHMIFGIKVLCALIIFFLASALAGRAKVFEPIRKNARVYLTVVLLLGGLVLVCATLLHYLPLPHPPAP